MNWKKALKQLDIHWATGNGENIWHLAGVHTCGDYHSFCGSEDVLHRFPADEGDPADRTICPQCLFKLGKLIFPLVHNEKDSAKLHHNMVSLQENLRLREYVDSVRN